MKTRFAILSVFLAAGVVHLLNRTQATSQLRRMIQTELSAVSGTRLGSDPTAEDRGTDLLIEPHRDPLDPGLASESVGTRGSGGESLPQAAIREIERCLGQELRGPPPHEPTSLTAVVRALQPKGPASGSSFLHWENFHLRTESGEEIRVRNLPTEKKIQLFKLDTEGLPISLDLPESWLPLPRESQLEEALKLGKPFQHQQSFSLSTGPTEMEWEEHNQVVIEASIRTSEGKFLGCTPESCVCE